MCALPLDGWTCAQTSGTALHNSGPAAEEVWLQREREKEKIQGKN